MTWLHRYLRLLVCATWLLVAAGGMVTSTSSGLSVPDWPTTYGYSMFTFPLSKMVGGIFYEHGHRLIASSVGFLTIGLVLLQWRLEPRRWVRLLGWIALGAVVLQGVLGGLTVLFFLPPAISIGHAGLAQLFFAMTVALALVTSRAWLTSTRGVADGTSRLYASRSPRLPASLPPSLQASRPSPLRARAIGLCVLIYVQILIGATMRHIEAGLAIPDFPLSFGRLVPPVWTAPIAINFAHRVGALLVTMGVVANVTAILRRSTTDAPLARAAWILLLAVATQITLGASIVWTAKNPIVNTSHVATGAIVFVTSVVIALLLSRSRFPVAAVAS